MSEIIIAGTKYEIIDTKSEITLADSFTKNKIGSAHGEAKLYVGMCNDNFFEDFSSDFFFLKQDFRNYLDETKSEFLSPKHNYKNVKKLSTKYKDLSDKINSYPNEPLLFNLQKSKCYSFGNLYKIKF